MNYISKPFAWLKFPMTIETNAQFVITKTNHIGKGVKAILFRASYSQAVIESIVLRPIFRMNNSQKQAWLEKRLQLLQALKVRTVARKIKRRGFWEF